MQQENADERCKKAPRKKSWVMRSCLPLLGGVLTGVALSWVGPYPFPLNTMPIEGAVVVLDENGEAIPFQSTRFTCFSHFAPALSRSQFKRTQNFTVDESGKFRAYHGFVWTLVIFYTLRF
jgi:hypothetical protein